MAKSPNPFRDEIVPAELADPYRSPREPSQPPPPAKRDSIAKILQSTLVWSAVVAAIVIVAQFVGGGGIGQNELFLMVAVIAVRAAYRMLGLLA